MYDDYTRRLYLLGLIVCDNNCELIITKSMVPYNFSAQIMDSVCNFVHYKKQFPIIQEKNALKLKIEYVYFGIETKLKMSLSK